MSEADRTLYSGQYLLAAKPGASCPTCANSPGTFRGGCVRGVIKPTSGLVDARRFLVRGAPCSRWSRPNWGKPRTYLTSICPGPSSPEWLTSSPATNRCWASLSEIWLRVLASSIILRISAFPILIWLVLGLVKCLTGRIVDISHRNATRRTLLDVLIF